MAFRVTGTPSLYLRSFGFATTVVPHKDRATKLQYLKDYRAGLRLKGLPTGGRGTKYTPEPEQHAANSRAWLKKLYADPERHKAFRTKQKKHYHKHKVKLSAKSRAKRQALKLLVITHYGGKCAHCPETELEFLTLDHVADDGNAHRAELGKKCIYRFARDAGFPPRFQCLCFNCNFKKSRGAPGTSVSARSLVALRLTVLTAYGAACTCCGEDEEVKLALDHVDGGGREHRGGSIRGAAYRDARDRGYPPDYQILCHNCNASKAFGGTCVHQRGLAGLAGS